MNPSSGELVFNATPFSLSAATIFVLVVAGLAFLAWKRSGWRPGVAVLETLRVLIAIAIGLTLNQPEWHETFKPESKPVVAVLYDESGSMETRDLVDAAGDPISRAEAAVPMTDPALWEPVQSRMDTVIEAFSSAEDPPSEGTDLNAALMRVLEQQPRLAAVVLATDGDWNTGDSPALAATRLRMRGVPVIAVALGADTRLPDVEIVSFDVPTFAVAGKPLRIPFSIDSALPRDEPVTITMATSAGEEISQQFILPAMGRLQDALSWQPGAPGEVTLSLEVPEDRCGA